MGKIINIEENRPHKVSEVMCVKCFRRWIAARPVRVLLKEMDCPNCGAGFIIETGEEIEIDEL